MTAADVAQLKKRAADAGMGEDDFLEAAIKSTIWNYPELSGSPRLASPAKRRRTPPQKP